MDLLNYSRWINCPELDKDLKAQMMSMTKDEAFDAFYCDLEFGTAGLRGILGPGTNRMNIYVIRKASEAFARYLVAEIDNSLEKGIVIAHDNRRNSLLFCVEAAKVFSTHGIKVYIFDSLRPTPELSYAVRKLNACAGIVITASHNPKEYNGYKVYDENGCQLVPKLIDRLLVYYNQVGSELDVKIDESKAYLITKVPTTLDQEYYNDVLKISLRTDLDASKLKVVYSPQHGTGYKGVKYLLTKLGYDLVLVEDQCYPNPDFINTVVPNPEDHRAYIEAIEISKQEKADIIITTDPDADRIGVVEIHNDLPVYFTGNQMGAMLIEYIIETRKELNIYDPNYILFNTIVTSPLGAAVAKKHHVEVVSTLTGFKFIGEQIHLLETTNSPKKFMFGYEESYGFLISSIARDKDALQGTVMICEMANYYKSKGKTLYDVLNHLYDEYGYHFDQVISVYKEGSEGVAKIQKIMDIFRVMNPSQLCGYPIKAFEDYQSGTRLEDNVVTPISLPKSNVLRFVFADGGFIAIRPSGTEPKCKFYYNILDKDYDTTNIKAHKLQDYISSIVEKI